MDNIVDGGEGTWFFSLNKKELKKFNITDKTLETGKFDIPGVLDLFSKNTDQIINDGFVEFAGCLTKDGADFEIYITTIEDILDGLTDEELEGVIDALEKPSKWWRYTFSSLNKVEEAAYRTSSMPSSLIKIRGTYHLFGKGDNPVTLSEYGIKENMDKKIFAYLSEHGTTIIKDNAIGSLKVLSKIRKGEHYEKV